ncbi:hypothetical protein BDQ12DRAFT_734254 [Crucibulum laeve]|uniref:BTB domain-containing protein n=1 Tax=Crucibulum laeve TaxID=68775 RepID=A0A5C3M5Q9_9AGAR|nr:hypothetical protein BDQ12DRAFT_734254 [Crucibulum laeve]
MECTQLIGSSFRVAPQPRLPIRSEQVWFGDGTIVLETEMVQFKVYQGTLAANSPIFHAMFSACQEDGSDMIENCPVIHLHDTAVDLMHFLQAMHILGYAIGSFTRPHFDILASSPSYYDCKTTDDFNKIAGILRLSTKYDVEHLRRRTFEQLAFLYPTTLEQWDQRVEDAIKVFEARPFVVVKLARETGHLSLLPAAMYLCATRADINHVLDGAPCPDGYTIELDWEDKRACLHGRETLASAVRTRLFKFITGTIEIHGHCTSAPHCEIAKYRTVRRLEVALSHTTPAVFSTARFTWPNYRQDVCKNCAASAEAHFDSERVRLWEELPSFFGLPSWEDLRKADDLVLTTRSDISPK